MIEFLGYWMAQGWLAERLAGGGRGWLGCVLGGGLAAGTLEPRQAGSGRLSRSFGRPEPTQLSRRNPFINSGYQTPDTRTSDKGLGRRDH